MVPTLDRDLVSSLAGAAAGLRAAARTFRQWPAGADPRIRKALTALTPAAAAAVLAGGGRSADFFEQVEYNARRLARLNVPAEEVARTLARFDKLVPLSPGQRRQLRLATCLAVKDGYFQVHQSETAALYDLFRAELEARSLQDLLTRSVRILTRTLRAGAGRLLLETLPPPLRRARYVEAGEPAEALIDPALRGRHAAYWSVPLFREGRAAGMWQFGFDRRYPWLPRELILLDAAAERCLAAAERRRLVEEVRRLGSHVLQVEEAERRRISRELHDQAGQSLMLLRMELERLESSAPQPWKGRLAEVRGTAESAIGEIRRTLAALSPAALERYGLRAGIRALATAVQQAAPLEVRLRMPEADSRLPREMETVLYRLTQECLQNAVRHAGAGIIKISLGLSDKWVELSVADNGAGFNVERALGRTDSFGLAGMRERVALAGGEIQICSRPGRGTAIRARLPLPQRSAAEGSCPKYASSLPTITPCSGRR